MDNSTEHRFWWACSLIQPEHRGQRQECCQHVIDAVWKIVFSRFRLFIHAPFKMWQSQLNKILEIKTKYVIYPLHSAMYPVTIMFLTRTLFPQTRPKIAFETFWFFLEKEHHTVGSYWSYNQLKLSSLFHIICCQAWFPSFYTCTIDFCFTPKCWTSNWSLLTSILFVLAHYRKCSRISDSAVLHITYLLACLLINLLTSKSPKLRIKLLNGFEPRGEFCWTPLEIIPRNQHSWDKYCKNVKFDRNSPYHPV